MRLRHWMRGLRYLMVRHRFARELDAELAFHINTRAEQLEAEGLTREAARRQARLELGNPLQIREASREVWVSRWLDQLTQDARFTLRTWRRHPLFAATVIATLALGIGANTAIFSLVDGLILRRAPFADPD